MVDYRDDPSNHFDWNCNNPNKRKCRFRCWDGKDHFYSDHCRDCKYSIQPKIEKKDKFCNY